MWIRVTEDWKPGFLDRLLDRRPSRDREAVVVVDTERPRIVVSASVDSSRYLSVRFSEDGRAIRIEDEPDGNPRIRAWREEAR